MPGSAVTRDRVTVLAYLTLAAYSYLLYSLGTVLPFLHDELHLSYTVTSLHSSLWVLGTIATGLAYGPLVRRYGRDRVLACALAGTAAGAVLLGVGHTLSVTLLSVAVMGTAGTALQTGAFAVLSDRHGSGRGRALAEATAGASATAVVAPLVLGGLSGSRVGWRAGLAVPVLLLAAVSWRRRGQQLPTPERASGLGGRLPPGFWTPAVLVAVVVGVEFCVVFYGADLLHVSTGLALARAGTAIAAFYLGELTGRAAGSLLAGNPDRTPAMLVGSLALTAGGFAAFWLSGHALVGVVGLFVTGLGVANLYPLALSLTIATAPGRADDATARVQLLVGAAVLVAPLGLGAAADRIGVFRAFGLEPALLGVALVLVVAVRHGSRGSGGPATGSPADAAATPASRRRATGPRPSPR